MPMREVVVPRMPMVLPLVNPGFRKEYANTKSQQYLNRSITNGFSYFSVFALPHKMASLMMPLMQSKNHPIMLQYSKKALFF